MFGSYYHEQVLLTDKAAGKTYAPSVGIVKDKTLELPATTMPQVLALWQTKP